MFMKAKFFKDDSTAELIMATKDPVLQKNYGKSISAFQKDRWSEVQDDYMKDGIRAKFVQNMDLQEKLLATGHQTLVEANPFDTYWSCGLSQADPNIVNEEKHRGNNVLGKLLMELRADLS